MTTPTTEQALTHEEGVAVVAAGTTTLLLVSGDVSTDTFGEVLEACKPKPVKVGVFNASQETVQGVLRHLTMLRVGPEREDEAPKLTVVMTDKQVVFAEHVSMYKGTLRVYDEIYNVLLPFDGRGLESSLAQATPERRDVINWLVGGNKEDNASAMMYARLRTFPRTSTVMLGISAVVLALGLTQSGLGLLEIAGVGGLLVGLGMKLNLRTLRKKFGYDHA